MDERFSRHSLSIITTSLCLLIFSCLGPAILPIDNAKSDTQQKAMGQQQEGNVLTLPTLGIKVQYPSNWNGGPIGAGLDSRLYFAPSNYAPQGGPTVYIDVFRNTTLDQLVHMLTPVSPGPKPINVVDGPVKSVPGSFHGNPANLLSYNWKFFPENLPRTNMSIGNSLANATSPPSGIGATYEVLTSNGSNSYLLAYIADKTNFETFFPVAQKIINSFEITNPPSQSIPSDTISAGCVFMPGYCVG
jgi:hypothetical protein